jgi:hypothetical protein
MTSNHSLSLSLLFKEQLSQNLLPAFEEDFPKEIVSAYVEKHLKGKTRDKVYTVSNTLATMILTATQEDKSLQQSVNLFKYHYEKQCANLIEQERNDLEEAAALSSQSPRSTGRPRLYKSKIPKSKTQALSSSPVAYCNARARLPIELVNEVFASSADFGDLNTESWYGLHTYVTDGTYLQLQDTESIRASYPPIESNGMFPQALLQVFIRLGSGQISQYSIGNRKQSELQLVIPMIKELKESDLLLADDLYNSYYHFHLILSQKAHMIVPGKRERNYTLIKQINQGDQIVEIKKGSKPEYISKEEWDQIPSRIQLRRIEYKYPTQDGLQSCVLYSTLTDPKIKAVDIILKYATRWDIEISIREIKTLMDIHVLRSKTPGMLEKELAVSLIAYNLVRKIIARSAGQAGFPPQEDIFQKRIEIGRTILMDKKGRVFNRWSPGRYGKTVDANQ